MSATTHKFQAEVGQVLHLVIHSLYSHKEIFLRELVSNASDALDKLRFRALTEPQLTAGDDALEIRLVPDPEKKTLIIEDTGIGMTEAELAENLGTIAHSGSRAFLEQLAKQGSEKEKVTLIGQFGVGFYSAYLVADRVDVISRAAGSEKAFRWTSDGKDSFTIVEDERAQRGTSVVLHLRADQEEFLEDWRLRELVVRYSDFVAHPIKLKVTRKAKDEDSDEEKTELETINKASALWQRSKSEITDEQYAEFYRHLTHDPKPPLARAHFRVEGSQEFAALLFVPQQPEPDFFAQDRKRGVRLFVKRVFIMEDCEELLPQWLRFVRGVVDSDDLPLNVSRETLQDSAAVRAIKKQLTKKVLDLLDDVNKERPEDYATFWKGHGSVLKTGLAIDFEYKERLGNLLRFESSHTVESGGGLTSLADYVSRMKEKQDAIYYVLGESVKALAGSPHLEALRARGFEVLYMTDPVDEWATDGLREFSGKKLVSAMRADLPPLDDSEEAKKAKDEAKGTFAKLTARMTEVLGERVREVRISERLTDSPVCLVVGEGSHAYLERMLRERGHAVQKGKRILEINPQHPLVESMRALAEQDASSERLTTFIETLYDQALVTEGSPIEDPARFAKNLTQLLTQAARR
jgi:molecular chaperone HtpG